MMVKYLFKFFMQPVTSLTLFLSLLSLATGRKAQAYPSFIGYGYTSCIVCHFNALGNGPLTDYGRALGATAISSKPFYNSSASDQDLGESSAFLLGAIPLPDFLRLQGNYRGLRYTSGIGNPKSSSRYINMQIDGSLIVKGLDDRLVAVINGGYQPAQGPTAKGQFLSREHYLSFAITPKFRTYVGLMDAAFGIRTPDHVAFNRKITKLAQNDQVHGLLLHYGTSSSEFALHGFVGNLMQDAHIRPMGASFIFETDVAEKVRWGVSSLMSSSTVRNRKLVATHTRAGVGKGSSLLLETGFVFDSPKEEKTLSGHYLYTQSMTRLFRGFHFLFTAEYSTRDAFRPNPRVFRVGPSLQYFLTSYSEFRLDFWGSRTIGLASEYDPHDTYEMLAQVHLWF